MNYDINMYYSYDKSQICISCAFILKKKNLFKYRNEYNLDIQLNVVAGRKRWIFFQTGSDVETTWRECWNNIYCCIVCIY